MTSIASFAATAPDRPLGPFSIDRRDPTARDVEIEILFCGVCHTDIHIARNEWKGTTYPVVPGHEIIGRVTRVGGDVTRFQVGDQVGVGCLVGSCGHCSSCRDGLENYCTGGAVFTYNSPDPHDGSMTYGGYSTSIVVDEGFVLRIPEGLDLAASAPLLCAGITTYSPLRHWKVESGQTVGVVGLGGLGHMGVKFAHAMGAHTVLFTTSPGKEADARRLGADEVVISRDADAMKRQAGRFDFLLDTVSAAHDLDPYLNTLTRDGVLCLVGVPEHAHSAPAYAGIVMRRLTLAGSMIGGIAETQEMLDFCGKHGIVSEVELISMQQINEAYDRILRSDVKYRFVIDLGSLR